MKLYIVLGNQLFPLKYLEDFKDDHIIFMAEDNGLCTYEKHHKLKILLFLSAMRSYADNLKKNNFKIEYVKIDTSDFKKEYLEKLKKVRQITEIPNFWKSLANNPETLERTWTSLQQVMKDGTLNPVVKEMIYIAVSITNGCEYCIKSHSLAAKKKGATEEMLSEMIAVTGMANETNRLVEGYQVEVDDVYK